MVVLTTLKTFCKPLATFCKPLETFCNPLATFCRPLETLCKPELDYELQNVARIGWTRLQFVDLPLLVTIGITVLQLNEGFELVIFIISAFILQFVDLPLLVTIGITVLQLKLLSLNQNHCH